MLAGIPSIPIAHTKEQEFWGLELKRLDIAPNLLIRRKVTPRKLAERISTVVNSPTMQENAQKIAQLMKIENGVSKAVELINRKFN
jgi:UDP:flavonoid glycosyltransferase YjiC (YdhE family)